MLFSRRSLDPSDYRSLVDRCQIIERDSFGEKVLQTPDGLIVKIFRRKRLLTTATVYPYALRFVRNVARLTARGVPTVEILEYARCPVLQRHLVTYRPLPGMTVRSALKSGTSNSDLLTSVARFVADLHRKGICFRSLHFGNIIVAPEQATLGLIDVADMTMHPWSLGVGSRERNFRHLLRYREDAEALQAFGWMRFVESYLEAAGLSSGSQRKLLATIGDLPEGVPSR
jgi:hypothetical protein